MTESSPRLQAEKIFEILGRHEVRYVVIGGLGALFHGSPIATNDADICPSRDPDNLERLASALRELDARIRTVGEPQGLAWAADAVALARAEIWNLVTRYGVLDISFFPSGTTGYEDLRREAVVYRLDTGDVPVASLADIIRSKESAGREKDERHLPTLRKLLERISEPES